MLPLYSAVLSSDGLFADLIDLRGLYGAGCLRLTVDRGSVRLSAGAAPDALDVIGDYSVGVFEVSIPLTRWVKVERLTGNSSTILVEILPHTADKRNVTAVLSDGKVVIPVGSDRLPVPAWAFQNSGRTPLLLSFGCSISQQQNAYMYTATTTSGSGDQAVGGKYVFNVANGALLTVGDVIYIPVHSGRLFRTTVTAINTNAVTVADQLPGLIRSQSTISKASGNQIPTIKQPLSAIGAANALLGGPFEMCSPYGYGGAVYQAMIHDLDRELRWSRPNVVALHLFENDLTSPGGVAGATTLTQFKQWARESARMCLRYGAIPIQCSQMPYYNGTNGVPASRAADWDGLRDYLCKPVTSDGKSQFEIDVPGAIGCNLSDGWLDPAYINDATWPRRPLAGWTDGVHPTSAKRFDVGQFAKSAVLRAMALAGVNTVQPWSERTITNYEFTTLQGSGGVLTNMQSGSIAPTGLTVVAYGAAIATSSRNADGSLKLQINWPTASQGADGVVVKYFVTWPLSAYGYKSRFRGFSRFRINAKSGIAQIYPDVINTGAGISDQYYGEFGNDIANSMPADGSPLCLYTPEFWVGVGVTQCQLSFEVRPTTGASGASIDIDLLSLGIAPVTAEIPHNYV